MGQPGPTSVDILQDSAALTGNGFGQKSGANVAFASRSSKSLELWVEVSAIDPGVTTGEFILEVSLDNVTFSEAARVSNIIPAAVPSPPQAFPAPVARANDSALGKFCRLRYEIVGGNITAAVRVLRRE